MGERMVTFGLIISRSAAGEKVHRSLSHLSNLAMKWSNFRSLALSYHNMHRHIDRTVSRTCNRRKLIKMDVHQSS